MFPHIGNFPAKQIIPAQILEILEKADRKNDNSVANEAKRTMASIFEFAIATLRATNDPVHPVRKALLANKTQHKRPLTTDEIERVAQRC